MIFGGVVIHVKSGHGVDPYLEIPMPRSMNGWWKKWFYLKNDASAPLPEFTGGRPVPLSSWGGGVAGKDLGKLQLRQEGLTRVHLLWTFLSHRIQLLQSGRSGWGCTQGQAILTAPPLRSCAQRKSMPGSIKSWISRST
jgi:hypothetical protein